MARPRQPAGLRAIGFDGQQVVVEPEHDLVVVITATDADKSETLREEVMAEFAR